MKKAISITLNGLVFVIEEDALQKLSAYFDSIKAYYGSDGEEITKDIEADIAERFKARNGDNQKVITIFDVEEIIKIIGTVNQIENEEEQSKKSDEKKSDEKDDSKRPRRLYRDVDNAILGGVCSGLAAYFSLDPVIVRLALIILTFFNGVGVLIYLVMLLVVPKAETSVQKLEMQGEPINLKNIEEVIKEKSELVKEQGKKAYSNLKEQKSFFYKLLQLPVVLVETLVRFLKAVFGSLLPIVRILVGVSILMGAILSFIFLSFGAVVLLFKINSPLLQTNFPLTQIAGTTAYFATIISVFMVCLIMLIVVTMVAASILRKKNIFNWIITTILLALWVLNVTIASIFGFDLALQIKDAHDRYVSENMIEKNIDLKDFSTVNGWVNAKMVFEKSNDYAIHVRGLKKDVETITFSIEPNASSSTANLKISQKYKNGLLLINDPVEIVIKAPDLKSIDVSDFLSYESSKLGTSTEIIHGRGDGLIDDELDDYEPSYHNDN